MKKTVKIIAFVLLLALAVCCAAIIIKEIAYVSKQIESWKIASDGIGLKQHIETLIQNTVSDLLLHFVALLLLVLNAFFILFDFYCLEPVFNFQVKMKARREAKREESKQKKYAKLKSKIEKIESDE